MGLARITGFMVFPPILPFHSAKGNPVPLDGDARGCIIKVSRCGGFSRGQLDLQMPLRRAVRSGEAMGGMRRLPDKGASRVVGSSSQEKREGQAQMSPRMKRTRNIAGWAVVSASFALLVNLTLVYANLGYWLNDLGGISAVCLAFFFAVFSYLMYLLLVQSYFRWRVLELAESLMGSLLEDLVSECHTQEASTYVALFSLFQFSRMNGLRRDEFDAIFFGLFPSARTTLLQRKVMNELCGLAPTKGAW